MADGGIARYCHKRGTSPAAYAFRRVVRSELFKPGGHLLLERREELRALADAARILRSGREGRILVIEGPAGIGKTVLLDTLKAESDEFCLLTADGSETERDFAFGVVLSLLAGEVERRPDESLFRGAAGLSRPLFESGLMPSGRDSAFALFHGLDWLCANLSEERPLLLCVDDIQWADAMSIQFLAYLAARLEELPLLLALARRTGEETEHVEYLDAIADSRVATIIRPGHLSRAAVSKLVDRELGDAAGDEQRDECWRISGGNPFFAREWLTGLRRAEDPGSLLPASNHRVPEAVTRLVARRFARLAGPVRAAGIAMAVLGDHATQAEIAALAGLDVEGIMRVRDRLAEAELIDPGEVARYLHPILRQAVLETLGSGERAQVELKAARTLRRSDPLRAAGHFIQALPDGPSQEPWAVAMLNQAADLALARGGDSVAITFLRRALEEEPEQSERRAILLELGRLEAQATDYAAIAHLAEAAELAGDPVEHGRIALVRGEALFQLVALEDSARVCREAIAALPESERELALALESAALNAEALLGINRDRPAELAAEVEAGATPGERMVLVHVTSDLAATGLVPAARVAELGERALGGGALLDEVGPASPVYIYAGTALAWAGHCRTVSELTSEGLRRGQERGSVIAISYSAALRSGAALLAGDLDRAEEDAELVVSGLPGTDPMAYAVSLAWLIEAWVERGRPADAREKLEASGMTGELPELGTIAFLILARGALLAAEGDEAAALAEYEEVGRRTEKARYGNPAAMDWRSRAALLHHRAGRRDRALDLVREELRLAEAFGAPRAIGVARRALGQVTGGSEGIADLEAATALLEPVSALEHARAVIALGAEQHRQGLEAARETLYRGMDLAHHAGSHSQVGVAMAALRETGARPRPDRLPSTSPAAPPPAAAAWPTFRVSPAASLPTA